MVRLRSNEQLVPVGGSHSMPKYTYGRLARVDRDKATATLGLGALHKVAVGDRFEIGHDKGGGHWQLTITRVEPNVSHGTIETLPSFRPPPEPTMPEPMMDATLMKDK